MLSVPHGHASAIVEDPSFVVNFGFIAYPRIVWLNSNPAPGPLNRAARSCLVGGRETSGVRRFPTIFCRDA
jgi:hypothetical protein